MSKRWHTSRNNPANVCRYIKGLGLVTVFVARDGFKFAYEGYYSQPYRSQHEAQLAAEQLADSGSETMILADSQDEEESIMEETAAQAAPEYASKAKVDKLVAYVNQLVKEHNDLCDKVTVLTAKVDSLENNQVPFLLQQLADQYVQHQTANDNLAGTVAALEAQMRKAADA